MNTDSEVRFFVLRLRLKCEHGEWLETFQTKTDDPVIALRQIEMLLGVKKGTGVRVVGFAWDHSPSSFDNAIPFPVEL